MTRPRRQQPLRVAILTGPLGLGGAEQQLYYLLGSADRLRVLPQVISVGGSDNDPWCGRIRSLGVKITHVGAGRQRAYRVRELVRLLRSERIDVVHAWLLYLNLYAAAAGTLARVPVRVAAVRGDIVTPIWGRRRWAAGLLALDAIIANSAVGARTVPRLPWFQPDVVVVHNGVEIPAPVDESERRLRRGSIGVPPAARVVVGIGRLDRNKNFDMLVRSFANVASRHRDVHLAIIGEGPGRDALLTRAHELGLEARVHLPGEIPDARRLLGVCDVLCLTSHREGLPNVVLEGSAAGLPVITTNAGGAAEVVEQGQTGFVVAKGDAAAMSGHLDVLLADPRLARDLGANGRERMRRHFSISDMVDRTVDVYERILSRRGWQPASRIA